MEVEDTKALVAKPLPFITKGGKIVSRPYRPKSKFLSYLCSP